MQPHHLSGLSVRNVGRPGTKTSRDAHHFVDRSAVDFKGARSHDTIGSFNLVDDSASTYVKYDCYRDRRVLHETVIV
jgi:hypothetical protein